MEQKDSYKVRLNEPVVLAPVGGEREHAKAGDIVTVNGDDAHNIIASGKGTIIDGELPNPLKGTPGRSARQ